MGRPRKPVEELEKKYTEARKDLSTAEAVETYKKATKSYLRAIANTKARLHTEICLAFFKDMVTVYGTGTSAAYDEFADLIGTSVPGPTKLKNILSSTPDDSVLYLTAFMNFAQYLEENSKLRQMPVVSGERKERAESYPTGSLGRIINLLCYATVLDMYEDGAAEVYEQAWQEKKMCPDLDESVTITLFENYAYCLMDSEMDDRAMELCREVADSGSPLARGSALLIQGEILMNDECFKEALEPLKEAHDIFTSIDPEMVYTQLSTVNLADAYICNEMYREAYDFALGYLNESDDWRESGALATLHYYAAEAALALGNTEEALKIADNGTRAETTSRVEEWGQWYPLFAECYETLGDKENAKRFRNLEKFFEERIKHNKCES